MANYERTPGISVSHQTYDGIEAEIIGSSYLVLSAEGAPCYNVEDAYLEVLSERYGNCDSNMYMEDLALALEEDETQDQDGQEGEATETNEDFLYEPEIDPFMCGVYLGNRIAHSELGSSFEDRLQAALSLPSHVSEAIRQYPGDNARLKEAIKADAHEGFDTALAYIPLALRLFDAFEAPDDTDAFETPNEASDDDAAAYKKAKTRENRVKFGQGFGVVMQKIHLAKQTTG